LRRARGLQSRYLKVRLQQREIVDRVVDERRRRPHQPAAVRGARAPARVGVIAHDEETIVEAATASSAARG